MKTPKLIVNIAKDFSPEPIGRYVDDGPASGQAFLEKVLLPALKKAVVVQVVLDGTEGYGSSFLDEAFAGLVRHPDFKIGDFGRRIELVSDDDPTLITEILGYVADEEQRKETRL